MTTPNADYDAYKAWLASEHARYTTTAHQTCLHACFVPHEIAYSAWLAGVRHAGQAQQEPDYSLTTRMSELLRAYDEGRYIDFNDYAETLTDGDIKHMLELWDGAARWLRMARHD